MDLSERNRTILAAAAIVAASWVAYGQVRHHDFVTFDDPRYVEENDWVKQGLTAEGVRWAMTTTLVANWHPVTWLSHMADVELFGMDPGAHHLVSLVIHLLNSALVFWILQRTTAATGASVFVAGLFALHPLHAESVAWIAERKDVLSTFLGLLAIVAYTRYVDRPSLGRYSAVAILLALSLAAKPMLVTLPVVLLALDYWPLARPRPFSRLALEKLPLLVLSAASTAITILAQRGEGAMRSLESVPVSMRLGNALVSYVTYLGKAVWPSGLAVYYPYPSSLSPWAVAGAALVLAGITSFVVLNARRRPHALAGWSWYLVTLLPVIGLIQVGEQAMADRYTYVPLIGIFIMAAWGLPTLWRPAPLRTALTTAAAVVVLLALTVTTRIQVGHWRDGFSLFSHALRVTEANALAHQNLGTILNRRKDRDGAIRQYELALEIDPNRADARVNLGVMLLKRGDMEGAEAHFTRVLGTTPDHADALFASGWLLETNGDPSGAASRYQAALSARPGHLRARNNLGVLSFASGDLSAAAAHFEAALERHPANLDAVLNLGRIAYKLASAGRAGEARAIARTAIARADWAGHSEVANTLRSAFP